MNRRFEPKHKYCIRCGQIIVNLKTMIEIADHKKNILPWHESCFEIAKSLPKIVEPKLSIWEKYEMKQVLDQARPVN